MQKKDRIRCLLYDLEIKKDPFDYANNWGDKHKFPVSTLSYGILTFKKEDLRILGNYVDIVQEEELGFFENELRRSDVVITWNGLDFDNTVMEKYLTKIDINGVTQFDLMVAIREITGVRFKLMEVAKAMKVSKIEEGANGGAVTLWQSDDINDRYRLCRYNIWDVNIMTIMMCLMANAERGETLKIDKYDREMKEVKKTVYLDWFELRKNFMEKFAGKQVSLFDS